MLEVKVDAYPSEHHWYAAIMGMRNPMNSWSRSDSELFANGIEIGKNDMDLMQRLFRSGTEHRKFMRMIPVIMTVKAPLYWWKEADTYKFIESNSCSTMHKLGAYPLTLDDFSTDFLEDDSLNCLLNTIECINMYRDEWKATKYAKAWWQMIQLLPSSYNQTRTISLNYETCASIIRQRTGHKLNEWKVFVNVLRDLPYLDEIMNGD